MGLTPTKADRPPLKDKAGDIGGKPQEKAEDKALDKAFEEKGTNLFMTSFIG